MSNYFAFQWHICDECDQRCKHCYIFAENRRIPLASMDFEHMKKVVAACKEFCKGYGMVPYCYVTGGDPILNPHFWNLLHLVASMGFPMTIMGNPFHLTAQGCAEMKECGVRKYQLSLDGLEKTHDWFRKRGSFKATLDAVPLINASGMDSVIMTTVSRQNYMELPGIIDAAVAAGASIFAFSRYVPTSCGKAGSMLSPQEYRSTLLAADRKFRQYEKAGCRTWFSRKDHLWALLKYEQGEFSIPAGAKEGIMYGGCNCGNSHLTILPNGDVFACRRVANSKCGNIFTQSLDSIWKGRVEHYRDFAAFSKCSRCELEPWCRGCPAVANGACGSFYAADPQCWKERNSITGQALA